MKGISNAVVAVLLMAVLLGAVGLTYGIMTVSLVAPVALVYDGEFGTDAAIATEGWFSSAFTETTDCNVTSEILGDSGYRGCIYETTARISAQNYTEIEFPFQFEIDNGPVQGGSIDMDLQNTGTLQAADDIVIKSVAIYTHDDEPVKIYDLSNYIENSGQTLDARFGALYENEYVLYTVFKTKVILPAGADGDDICKIKIKLTTSGDAKTAYVLAENG